MYKNNDIDQNTIVDHTVEVRKNADTSRVHITLHFSTRYAWTTIAREGIVRQLNRKHKKNRIINILQCYCARRSDSI